MKKNRGTGISSLIIICGLVVLSACWQHPPLATAPSRGAEFWPSSVCKNCHVNIFEQHADSMHARSFTNPLFQAQYFREILPFADTDEDARADADMCIACHSPISYIKKGGYVVSEEEVNPRMSGVTCDFCHTIKGYRGERPGNANYLSAPGPQKLGPFKHDYSWHHVYSELHTKSEFCAICHNHVNRHGLEVKATYTEWKDSPFSRRGIQCQDCHMNSRGYLLGGKAQYESGKAAHMTVGSAPYRKKLYTHRFPGVHSREQVEEALQIRLRTGRKRVKAGQTIDIAVDVENAGAGHSIPSGSAELRFLLLSVEARFNNRTVSIPAISRLKGAVYDLVGEREVDMLGRDYPLATRIYRAVYLDGAGKQTLSSYRAVSRVFDNRLAAGETRKERYRFSVPPETEGSLELSAHLVYIPYPRAMAEKLDVSPPEEIRITSARKVIQVRPDKVRARK